MKLFWALRDYLDAPGRSTRRPRVGIYRAVQVQVGALGGLSKSTEHLNTQVYQLGLIVNVVLFSYMDMLRV